MPLSSRTGVRLTLDPEGAVGTGTAGPSEPEEAGNAAAVGSEPNNVRPPKSRREAVGALIGRLVTAIRDGDEQMVESAVLALSQRSRWLAPLAMVVGAFAMLFQGVKLLFTNWRLTLVQILPAMWIWCAMLDLKAHVLHGKEFHILRGPWLIPVVLAVAAITAGSFFLNAVFAFAIAKPGAPEIRPAFAKARTHLRTTFAWGFGVGLALGFATVVADRWGHRGPRVLAALRPGPGGNPHARIPHLPLPRHHPARRGGGATDRRHQRDQGHQDECEAGHRAYARRRGIIRRRNRLGRCVGCRRQRRRRPQRPQRVPGRPRDSGGRRLTRAGVRPTRRAATAGWRMIAGGRRCKAPRGRTTHRHGGPECSEIGVLPDQERPRMVVKQSPSVFGVEHDGSGELNACSPDRVGS